MWFDRTILHLLPEEHGLIFPDGYYLQSGELKRYEAEEGEMLLERTMTSPNGEIICTSFSIVCPACMP